jgi:hypothetical protein
MPAYVIAPVQHSVNVNAPTRPLIVAVLGPRDEGWVEWTPTIGLSLRTHAWTLRYNFRYTCGPADCIDFMSGDTLTVTAPASGGIIAAPSATSSVNGGTTHVHQLMMTVPIR